MRSPYSLNDVMLKYSGKLVIMRADPDQGPVRAAEVETHDCKPPTSDQIAMAVLFIESPCLLDVLRRVIAADAAADFDALSAAVRDAERVVGEIEEQTP